MPISQNKQKPIFLLDASALLNDPEAIFAFKNSRIILPFLVLEALDSFKRDYSERGKNTRYLLELLEELIAQSTNKKLLTLADSNSTLEIYISDSALANQKITYNKKILLILEEFINKQTQPVSFITNDRNLRVRANILGFHAEAYEKKEVTGQIYGNITTEQINDTLWQTWQETGDLQIDKQAYPNEIVCFENKENTVLARYVEQKQTWKPIQDYPKGVWGISAKNKEQKAALELLMDKQIPLVVLVGKAGTGKTLLALAAAMELMLKQNIYEKILVSRPIFPMGRDMGYLPGNLEEKMEPWMQPIFDNLDFLSRNPSSPQGKVALQQKLLDNELLELESLTYIRGRSIPNRIMIIDEAQNLTPHEMKTIITRSGEGSKVVLTGDPYQIDNPYINPENNGLSYVINRLQSSNLTGHVNLRGGVRSPLAEVAATLLN